MALYDQGTQGNQTPWYAPQQQIQNGRVNQPVLNQFVWVNNQGTVDMWPVAAGSEMTFIDNENMMLYVKRVDEFGHPFRTRRFKLTEMLEDTKPEDKTPAVNMDELKRYLNAEVDKVVAAKLQGVFSKEDSYLSAEVDKAVTAKLQNMFSAQGGVNTGV